jgi:hypothetical protein
MEGFFAVYWFLAPAVVIALLIVLVVQLSSINRNTKKTAEYVRQLALCHPPSEEQARVINLGLSMEEVMDRLAAQGVTVTLRDTVDAVKFENAANADPELLRLVKEHRHKAIASLMRKKRKNVANEDAGE